MTDVVGVKFKEAGKMYYFSPGDIDVKQGDNVIVETARGIEFGKVTLGKTSVKESTLVAPLKNIIRVATPEDEKKLDRYEGFPRFYYKKEMKIRMWDQVLQKYRTVDAFVYIMHEDRPFGVPSPTYVATCMEGYADFEFDEQLLEDAFSRSMTEVARQEEEDRA